VKTKRSRRRVGWRSCKSSQRANGLPITWGTWNAQSASVARSKARQLLGPKSWPRSLHLSPTMTAVGTKKLTTFFVSIAKGDSCWDQEADLVLCVCHLRWQQQWSWNDAHGTIATIFFRGCATQSHALLQMF
jgi:hypothetical protein